MAFRLYTPTFTLWYINNKCAVCFFVFCLYLQYMPDEGHGTKSLRINLFWICFEILIVCSRIHSSLLWLVCLYRSRLNHTFFIVKRQVAFRLVFSVLWVNTPRSLRLLYLVLVSCYSVTASQMIHGNCPNDSDWFMNRGLDLLQRSDSNEWIICLNRELRHRLVICDKWVILLRHS